MRLFIAVRFDEPVLNRLCAVMDNLRHSAITGSFTRRLNLHLTLVFLGEISPGRVNGIIQAIDGVTENQFLIELGGVGHFERDNGDILWMGIHRCEPLLSVYRQLVDQLVETGYRVETRQYKPHLTLARGLRLPSGFDRESLALNTGIIHAPVTGIDLMKSERVGGVLTYTCIHTKTLSM